MIVTPERWSLATLSTARFMGSLLLVVETIRLAIRPKTRMSSARMTRETGKAHDQIDSTSVFLGLFFGLVGGGDETG